MRELIRTMAADWLLAFALQLGGPYWSEKTRHHFGEFLKALFEEYEKTLPCK